MAYSLMFDDALGCCFAKWSSDCAGLLTDVRAFYREVSEHPKLRPDLKWLHDVREADFDVTTEEVRSLVSLLGEAGSRPGPERRLAYLVSSDLNFGMVRMFEVLSEQSGVQIHVFRELVQAKAWLGLPATPDDPFDLMPVGKMR